MGYERKEMQSSFAKRSGRQGSPRVAPVQQINSGTILAQTAEGYSEGLQAIVDQLDTGKGITQTTY